MGNLKLTVQGRFCFNQGWLALFFCRKVHLHQSMDPAHSQIILSCFQAAELADERIEGFLKDWNPVQFSHKELITEAGQIERRLFVVISGVHAIYYPDRDGNRVVIGFAFDGSHSGVYDSFIDQSPSSYFLQSLTPSIAYWVSHESYLKWFDTYPGFDRWGRIVHGKLLIGRVERELELTTLSSEERFVKFMRRCPEPLHRIPQKWLASYLNMTPETFSRLMNSVAW